LIIKQINIFFPIIKESCELFVKFYLLKVKIRLVLILFKSHFSLALSVFHYIILSTSNGNVDLPNFITSSTSGNLDLPNFITSRGWDAPSMVDLPSFLRIILLQYLICASTTCNIMASFFLSYPRFQLLDLSLLHTRYLEWICLFLWKKRILFQDLLK
jgi:hypothetical protein